MIADFTTDPPAAPAIGLFEMVLEVADLEATEHFYHDLIGLPVVERWSGDRPGVWLGMGREATLGLWPPESGGAKAILHARGGAHVHFAIRVPRGTLAAVQARLERLGVPIKGGFTFGPGDHAIYLDDPDGNVVELTERVTLWGGNPTTE
jgi:catechol-2,3-dioxygenase